MIVVDSSVWIGHINGRSTPHVQALRNVLQAQDLKETVIVGDLILCEVLRTGVGRNRQLSLLTRLCTTGCSAGCAALGTHLIRRIRVDTLRLTLLRTDQFSSWLRELRDVNGRARIAARLDRASMGHFGDCRAVGEGVSEMRIDFGPGYRIYFTRCARQTYVLLAGGDKSTQQQDIDRAVALAKELKEERRDTDKD